MRKTKQKQKQQKQKKPTPVPERLTTVTPRLVVEDGEQAIAFYREAFGAKENKRARFRIRAGVSSMPSSVSAMPRSS